MHAELLPIYGPIAIQSFGLCVVIGLLVFSWFLLRYPKRALIISVDQYTEILFIGIIAGIIGGRLLYVITDWYSLDSFFEIFYLWNGGFSILGTIIAVAITLPLYLSKKHIPIWEFADLVAIHAPLLQSIARLGCFFAGCCYGMPTHAPWGVCYETVRSSIYVDTSLFEGVYLHPTQLYSALALFIIFIFMYCIAPYFINKRGQLLSIYLMLTSTERFIVDFWRADRIFIKTYGLLHLISVHQLIAFIIFVVAGTAFIALNSSAFLKRL